MSHRFRVHLHVADLVQSIGFCSKPFGATPCCPAPVRGKPVGISIEGASSCC